MAFPDDFINPIKTCLNPDFTFPSITQPGLPNFALACFSANFAGIQYVLDFLPPSPSNPPSLPSISIFLNAFLGSINLPSSYPGTSLGPLTIPGVGSAPYAYDLSGELKLMAICIVLPFQLISDMITGILNLEINLPTLSGILTIFNNLAISVGLSGVTVAKFGLCLAQSILNLFTALIPV